MNVKVVNFRSLVIWAVVCYGLWLIADALALTLLLFGLAFFFAILLDPPIRWLDRRGLSRGMSVAAIALGLLLAVGVGGYLAIPPLAEQIQETVHGAPAIGARLQQRAAALAEQYPFLQDYLRNERLGEQAGAFAKRALPQVGKYSLSLLSGLFSLLMVFILTLYTVASPHPLLRGALFALPKPHRKTALRILLRASAQLQAWVRATFWMMLVIGVLSGLGLWALGVRSPLLFGLLAGIGEAIPTVGPILSALPPFFVTLADDPAKAGWVLVLFLVVQQLENNLLVPRIMATAMKLHPVSVLFFVIAMGALMGPLGILLATPLCAIVKVVYQETYQKRLKAQDAERRVATQQGQTG